MTLRRARAADADLLASLAQWVWLDSYAPEGVDRRTLPYLAASFTPAVFEQRVADPACALWVLENGAGVLSGFAQLRCGVPAPVPGAQPDVELERLYVAPPCTGRGLGRELLAAARNTWAGRPIWLSVWVGNAGAQRFDQREGATVIGRTHFILDGEAIDNLVFAFP